MGGPSGQYPFGGWWRGRSIAGPGHNHTREQARRLRQAERIAANRAARVPQREWKEAQAAADAGEPYGYSRRGCRVAL